MTSPKTFRPACITLMLASLVLTGCGPTDAESDGKKDQETSVSIPVEAQSVQRGIIAATYTTTTTLESKADAEVNSKATGIVQDLLVEEGDHVVAG